MAVARYSRLKQRVYMWVAAAVVLVISIGGTAAQPKSGEIAAQSKKILFLHSFGQNFQPVDVWSREIRNELNRQSPWPLNIQDHSLVSALNGDAAAEAKFVEYLAALYAQRPPDLIVAINAPAARFVQQHRTDLYPTTPMLLAAVEARRVEQSMLSEHDAAVGMRFDQVALFENILRLLPETKTIAMIIGASPNERFWAAELQRILGPLLANKVELIFYNERPLEDILKEIADLPLHSAIFFLQLAVDGAGAVYGDKEPLKRIYEVAKAPIFSYDLIYFTGETVGGPMVSPAEGARPTAAVAVRMLGGEKGGSINVPPIEFSTPKYDWRQLQRWNISESRLPPGSEILFREPTAWERYSWQISATAAALLLQAVMISGLLYEHRRRRNLEVEARQRMAELAHMNRNATAGELSASIAHELNQPLGAILNNVETATIILNSIILKSPSPDLDEMKTIVDEIRRDDERATEVIQRLRRLFKKTAAETQNIDLNETVSEALKFLSVQAAARNVTLNRRLAQAPLRVSGDRIQLQQVILNFVINGMDAMAGAASGRREVTCGTSVDAGSAKISILDSGPGIPPNKLKTIFEPFFTTKGDGMGMGLSIARTIVEAHGGTIWAENRTGGGAVFHVSLPLAKAN